MQYFMIFLLMVAVLVLVSIPLVIFLHEVGHAIPAMLLTNGKVTIYLGTYGDPANSSRFSIGRLHVYVRRNLFRWRAGLCVNEAPAVSINRQLLFVIGGPLSSITVAVTSLYFIYTYDMHGALKLFLNVFVVFAFLDLLINIIPNPNAITLHNGTITHNDGYSFLRLLNLKRFRKTYDEACDAFNRGDYKAAGIKFNHVLQNGLKDGYLYGLVILSHYYAKEFQSAITVGEAYLKRPDAEPDNVINIALCYSTIGNHEQAIEMYRKVLKSQPTHVMALNNIGYDLSVLQQYEEAIPFLDKALELDNAFAYAYNNRGLCRVKTGDLAGGLADIEQSIKLDEHNAYGYRNLAVYYLETNQPAKAITMLEKAEDLDATVPNLKELKAACNL